MIHTSNVLLTARWLLYIIVMTSSVYTSICTTTTSMTTLLNRMACINNININNSNRLATATGSCRRILSNSLSTISNIRSSRQNIATVAFISNSNYNEIDTTIRNKIYHNKNTILLSSYSKSSKCEQSYRRDSSSSSSIQSSTFTTSSKTATPTTSAMKILPDDDDDDSEYEYNDDDDDDKAVTTTITNNDYDDDIHDNLLQPPWNRLSISTRVGSNRKRSRQHVNPLSRQFRMPTILQDNWPTSVYTNVQKPLHLDIGCGRGGFLLDLIQKQQHDQQQKSSSSSTTTSLSAALLKDCLPCNYLGLEIRPIVAAHAKERIGQYNLDGVLDFIGCNVNVDLERILHLYHTSQSNTTENTTYSHDNNNIQQQQQQNRLFLECVTIQFPDPLFKSKHAKRRVVTNELIHTLAFYMPPKSIVFLQSDVQIVLDTMRQQFRENEQYFQDSINDITMYEPNNIFNVPTERETSVLERDLPVFRAVFTRTDHQDVK